VKLFNNLSKNVRNECNFRKFVNELYKNLWFLYKFKTCS
jgi:hypothetical protein